jgi:hypothetical protein
MRFLEGPGYAWLVPTRYVSRADRPGEWQCLSVTLESGEPVPGFVNYLMIQVAMALWLRTVRE